MYKKIAIIVVILIMLLFSCDLFSPGLGDKIDLKDPTITFSSHMTAENVKGVITLSGGCNDDIGIKSVEVKLGKDRPYMKAQVNNASKSWQLNVDTNNYPDGAITCYYKVTDTEGKSIENSIGLIFDNTPPVIVVKNPTGYSNAFNGDLMLSGEAADANSILRVYVTLEDPLGNVIPIGDNSGYSRSAQVKDGAVIGRSAIKTWNQISASVAEADGTDSWNYIFHSYDVIPASGDYRFVVTAQDVAGNISTFFYHYDDLLPLNDNNLVVTKRLLKIEAGETDPETSITKAELESIRKTEIIFSFNQDLDKPRFSIYNPDQSALVAERILAGTGEIIGQVIDDDGLNISSLELRIDRASPSAIGDWEAVTNYSLSGPSANFQFELADYSSFDITDDGTYYLYYRVTDIYGKTFAIPDDGSPLEFKVDNGAPSISITSPTQNDYINSNFQITGTASDSDSVASVKISLNDGLDYYDADDLTSIGGGSFSWYYNVTVGSDGSLPIKVKAVDASGKTAYYNTQVNIDRTPPVVAFLNPTLSSSMNGQFFVKGTSSDNNQISKVELKIGGAIPNSDPNTPDCQISFDSDEFYNWQFSLDSMAYANSSYAIETSPGSNVWQLYIYARVTDQADNTTIISNYYFYVDSDLDKPTVNLISPANNQNIGGPVLISGTAFDDDAVHHVEIQMDVNGDGDFLDQIDFYDGVSDLPDGDTNDRFEDETQWYIVSGTTLWSQEINNFGELYSTEPGHTGDISIRIRAVDTKDTLNPDIAGNFQTVSIHLDNTIPRIESLSHFSSDYVMGDITLTGDALDDEEVASIWFSYNGGTNYTNIISNPGYVTQNAVNDYDIHIPINTNSFVPDSGILYLRLKVIDNANYQTISYINLNVDNLYPDALMTSTTTDIFGDSANARVQGTAVDSGVVAGVESIHVYFVRGIDVYQVKDSSPALPPVVTTIASRDFGDGNGSVYWISDSDYKIVIDNIYEYGADVSGNGDIDGHDESLTISGSTYNWWAEFDSNLIPDGAIEVHYVVFDSAGNGHHYEQLGFIKNNKPSIDLLTVGTDLDFDSVVEVSEQFEYTGAFSGRSLIYVDIDASDPSGGISSWEVRRVADDSLVVPDSGDYQNGAIIDISGETEGNTLQLYALITDTDGITAREDFSVIIDNLDVVGPSGYLDAITTTSVVDGHVEAIGESRDFNSSFDRTYSSDTTADVSGRINISGSASDDQRIQGIYLTISGYDADGAGGTYSTGEEFLLAAWDSVDGRLEYSTLLGYASNTPLGDTLDPDTGHDADFVFEWNSAEILTVAAEAVTIDLRVSDFGTGSDAADGITVDVVPYVTGINRTDGIGGTRTKLGKYSLPDGMTNLEVEGYNLDPSWVRIYNSVGGANTDLTGTITNIASDYTSFEIDLATRYSGYLWLDVAGVAAINNINNNNLDQNKQDDGSGLLSTLWHDDLYIELWDVDNDFQGSNDAEHAAMAVNSQGLHYAAWSYYNNSDRRYGTDTDYRNDYGENSWDPQEWNDIVFNHSNNDFFIVNLWNQNVSGNLESLRLHSFEGTVLSDNTDNIVVEDLDNLYQYQNPRIVLKPSGANISIIYISYYDALDTCLKFASFSYDRTNNNLTSRTSGTNMTVDNSGDMGLYSDIALDADGNPFIMYYDRTNSILKIARATDDDPDAPGEWNITTVDSGLSYFGEYVSIAVDDSDGTVHVSTYRNASGDLIYYEAPHNSSPGAYAFVRTIVDTEGNIGAWSEIAEYDGEPYISYISTSHAGTFHGLKYAYRDSGTWEYGVVPVSVPVQTERTGMVAKPPTSTYSGASDYTVSIGYNSGYYYFARLRPEQQ